MLGDPVENRVTRRGTEVCEARDDAVTNCRQRVDDTTADATNEEATAEEEEDQDAAPVDLPLVKDSARKGEEEEGRVIRYNRLLLPVTHDLMT